MSFAKYRTQVTYQGKKKQHSSRREGVSNEKLRANPLHSPRMKLFKIIQLA